MARQSAAGRAWRGTHGVAVRVAAGDGVGLVEQVVADFARQMGAQAVQIRPEGRKLRGSTRRPLFVAGAGGGRRGRAHAGRGGRCAGEGVARVLGAGSGGRSG